MESFLSSQPSFIIYIYSIADFLHQNISIIPRLVAFCVAKRALEIVPISHGSRRWVRLKLGVFGHLRQHSAILGTRSCHVMPIFGDQAQEENTMRCQHCRNASVAYSSNLHGLFGLNGTDGALEGHNIPQTAHRQMCE